MNIVQLINHYAHTKNQICLIYELTKDQGCDKNIGGIETNKGERLIELKILISEKSYKRYFENFELEIDPTHIFNLINKNLEVKKLEVHSAVVSELPKQLYVQRSGNGSIVTQKGWD